MRTFLKRSIFEFNVFFCFLTNSVFIKQNYIWIKRKLPYNCFYSVYSGHLTHSFVLKLFNGYPQFWKLFNDFISFNRKLTAGFFLEFELVGLGFRIKKITSTVYRFFWGTATFIYLFVPQDVLVEYSADDRVVFFFGIKQEMVADFSSYLILLKKLSTYRVTGFVQPNKIIRLKSGKQR